VRDDLVYLRHILDAACRIQEYVKGMKYADFMASNLVQDGVIRQLEIMGEASKNISASYRDSHPILLWKDMAGMRDKLIHQYFGVDLGAVWDSIEHDIPQVKAAVSEMLSKAG
jgi:uncharacterized protein with HEPN domain